MEANVIVEPIDVVGGQSNDPLVDVVEEMGD